MTLFDERERAFENLFVLEEERRFYERVRRNQLFARWAAEQLNLRGVEYRAYIGSLIAGAIRSDPDAVLIDQVRTDLLAGGVPIEIVAVEEALAAAAANAAEQVRTEARSGSLSLTA
jgi:hypothetical protein